ncbi:hypothetical protein GCM10011575_10700 [Microlunatus endophyticus]|uniref:CDP-Glycerol:Poly(Glycerophosphate) glycerophosphotransferase n=1 Tax=Microlunatus endophyticus TaxID=1716077 RepID=A0A917S4G6_9ACTN|nr:CDP-glycerol glycerophosphotransferase family protein [Microlunatus endophyticus]GGL54151.1 hypothetical protein GCM10011575_10700 [Microlunatus endophyticus]
MLPAEAGPQPTALRRFAGGLVADLAIAVLLALGGLAGVAMLGSAGPARAARWLGVVALAVAAAATAARFPRAADQDDPRESVYRSAAAGRRLWIVNGFGGLGRFPGLRTAAVGVAVLLGAGRYLATDDRAGFVLVTIAAAGLVLTIAAEPFVVRLLRLPAPYAVRLPGLPVLPARIGYAWLPAHLGQVATIAVGATAVAGAPGWVPLALAVLGAVPSAAVILKVRSRRQVAARIRTRLPGAMAGYAPEFVLYTARPDDASYQLTMWLPYLRRAGRPFVIVTRDELPSEAIAALTDLPVVCCRAVADLDLIMTESLRAAFYVNASSGNGALIRYHQLTHVYLGHGDSDKPPSYNPTHAMYDRIFTAGPAANRRYGEHGVLIDPAKFRIVGRPQVEVIRPADPDRLAARVAGARPVILYAPTWKGHVSETALSSLDRAEAIVAALLDRDAEVIFRPHPFSYDDPGETEIIERVKQRLAADRQSSSRQHCYGPAAETDLDAFGCMNAADVLISDVSSVVSDFLQSGKPYAMVAPPELASDRFVVDYPVARAGYLIDHELTTLEAVLDDLLVITGDRLATGRTRVRADYLGDFAVGGYAEHFTAAVREACDTPAPRIAEVAESDDGSTAVSRDTVRRNLDSLARAMSTGVAAVVALAAGVDHAVLLGAVAATIAALVAVLTPLTRRVAADPPPLDGARMIMALAAAAAAASGAPPHWLGPVLLPMIIGIAAETTIRSGWSYPGVIATGLAGLEVPASSRRPWLLPVTAAVTSWLAWPAMIIGATWPMLVIAALILAVLIMVAVATARARTRLAAALSAERAVPAVLAEFAPQFCVYFGSGIGAAYQVGMWLEYFRRLDRRFVIITRALPMQAEIVRLTRGTGIPVLFRPTLRSLEEVVVPSMRLAYYVNNAVRNTHLIERRELIHVWLNHGDSEKPACYNPVHAIYDKIFTAGQAGIDRYARHGVTIPAAKFVIVGRPQTETIIPASAPIGSVQRPTVLYAPTWQGPYADSRVYSLPVGLQLVDALLERGARVIFRAHPFNYRFAADRRMITEIGARLAADRARTGTDHLWGEQAENRLSVEDCFNASDAMICDVSAVISDYLAAAKPFAVVAVGRTEAELIAEAPAAAAGYPVAEDLSDLPEVLGRLLGTDPKAAERDRMRRYYLGELPNDRAAEGFLRASAGLLETTGPGDTPV